MSYCELGGMGGWVGRREKGWLPGLFSVVESKGVRGG